jgi:hypothetical protein
MTFDRPLPLIAVAVVAATLTATTVLAQEPPERKEPPSAADVHPQLKPASERNVRVDVTITLRGAKPVVKTLSMVAGDGRLAAGRARIEVAVNVSPSVAGRFDYRPVDINVDAIPTILSSGRISLRLKLNFATVYLPDTPEQRASFGQGTTDLHAVTFESGRPLIVTQASDGESGREYSVEVKATILK